MTETPSLSEALTTSLSPCTSLPTRQRVRTSTGGSDDEYFDVDIVSDEETLEHDIIDGDSSDIDEGVTTTVGVSAGFMAPLQGVVAITPPACASLPWAGLRLLLVDLHKLQTGLLQKSCRCWG